MRSDGRTRTEDRAVCHEGAAARSRPARFLWNAAGTVSLALGMIGIPLPFLPTTPFLLLAAACFVRGSPRMYRWMLTNKYFGAYLKNYMEGRGLPVKTKIASITMLWVVILLSMLFATDSLLLRVVLLAVGIGVTLHIVTIRTCPSPRETQR